MNVRVEMTANGEEEIVIRCAEKSEKTAYLETMIRSLVNGGKELVLYIGNTEYFLPKEDVLFFETYDGKVYAHTSDRMYRTDCKLFEVETMMTPYFVRVSKSAAVNVKHISSLSRELTGGGEIAFRGCDKTVRFSRGYYKLLKDKIEEMRF